MYKVLYLIALYSGIIPICLYLLRKGTKLNLGKEIVFPFITLTFIATIYEQIGVIYSIIGSSYWFQIYAVLEFTALFYYYRELNFIKKKQEFEIFFAVFFVFFYLISWMFFRTENIFLSLFISQIPIVLLVIVSSFSWFKKLFLNKEIKDLWKNADFYFVSGYLIYCASTFFLFSLSGFLVETSLYFYDYWLVNVLATLFLRIMLSIGVWRMKMT
ncbi:hypothetical protein [Myroides guanonis]|uniref:YhhN-like protein n=1 Tax=Myroides guanonis TaxID=1150112 RepID=A0A1I3M8A6_9FLAO|nr:hypothetical protein [Myroides guanonis]SFI93060.1 hypothetical protein SAMN04487893_10264 [Myroides guanonis]